jgi:serine/threonine protein kinase
MTPERARDIERICDDAMERPVGERTGFLAQACDGDSELRREVERLLTHEHASATFLETPPIVDSAFSRESTRQGLAVGQRIGSYTILSTLGFGGMGEVYRARDSVLGRDVAIKVLPAVFANDPDRLARFEREARMLAALNHPNIATIYGVERADGVQALVLEVVEGETLEQRLQRSGLPLGEALGLARQIAEALEAAHDHNVVHRDLKPANIKIRPDGVVKVLDFGLAVALTPPSDDGGVARWNSPADRTQEGMLLGTPSYMSPEQVQGQRADRRSDIWAFGAIVYEMLAGRPAVGGQSTVEVMSNVLKNDPDWSVLAATTPPIVQSLLRRMLQKEPSRRLRDVADARFQIEEALTGPLVAAAPTVRFRERLMWLSGLAIASVIGLWLGTTRERKADSSELRLDVTTPPTTHPAAIAMSPDGQTLAFAATSDGRSRLWLRRLSDATVRVLPGTEDAKFPFWSPDGRAIGFSVESDLKRVDIETGTVHTIAPYESILGGAWLADGSILATANAASSLARIEPTGGVSLVTQVTTRSFGHRFAQPLPDGRHFLFFAGGPDGGVYLGQLGDGGTRKILEADAAVYAATGHLFFVRRRTLFAQRFDTTRFELTGTPALIAQDIVMGSIDGNAALSVSAAGPIVYRRGESVSQRRAMWVDRRGQPLTALPGVERMGGLGVSVSDDDGFVAWTQIQGDIWLLELARGVSTRFTFGPFVELSPVWAPDRRRIVYNANTDGDFDLYVKAVSAPGDGERLLRSPRGEAPDDWSPDGRFILYTSTEATKRNVSPSEIWALPIDGDRTPLPIVRTPGTATNGAFSPDGSWVAFQSNESSQFEVYVQRFPKGDKIRISTGGGVQPRWRPDGKELFYIDPDNQLMAVPVDFSTVPPSIGSPVPLFRAEWGQLPHHPGMWTYSVASDGQRFLVDVRRESVNPITVLLNWKPPR